MKMPAAYLAVALGASLVGAQALAVPPALTPRQQEVAEMIARQDIAQPAPKLTRDGDLDPLWLKTHEDYVQEAKKGTTRLLFVGDSITAGWRKQQPLWQKYFGEYSPANIGIGGDRTQWVLWRLQNGELDGFKAKAVVLMVGTNNIGAPAVKVAEGITTILLTIREKQPQAKILLLGVFPRGSSYHDGGRRFARDVNGIICNLHDGQTIHYMDLTSKFVAPDGTLPTFPDKIHPDTEGYAIWAEAIAPKLKELMAE